MYDVLVSGDSCARLEPRKSRMSSRLQRRRHDCRSTEPRFRRIKGKLIYSCFGVHTFTCLITCLGKIASAQRTFNLVKFEVLSNAVKVIRVKRYGSSCTHLRATGRHLPYGTTQCYLPPDTSERAQPKPSLRDWCSINLSRSDGRLCSPRPKWLVP